MRFIFLFLFLLQLPSLAQAEEDYATTEQRIFNDMLSRNTETLSVPDGSPRLFYVGMAMWGGEPWSEADVLDMMSLVVEKYPMHVLVPYVLNNNAVAELRLDPNFHPQHMDSVLKHIRQYARQTDLVVVAWSTHGSPGRIFSKFRETEVDFGPEAMQYVQQTLATLPTLYLLSSCYSGSMIPYLATEHSVIITAANDSQPSFGCSPESRNSWFVRALKEVALASAGPLSEMSWLDIYQLTQDLVTDWEVATGLEPSQPQMFVGHKVDPAMFGL